MSLHIILEDDILECFLNDQYSLVTRLQKKPGPVVIKLLVERGHASFKAIQIYYLANRSHPGKLW